MYMYTKIEIFFLSFRDALYLILNTDHNDKYFILYCLALLFLSFLILLLLFRSHALFLCPSSSSLAISLSLSPSLSRSPSFSLSPFGSFSLPRFSFFLLSFSICLFLHLFILPHWTSFFPF